MIRVRPSVMKIHLEIDDAMPPLIEEGFIRHPRDVVHRGLTEPLSPCGEANSQARSFTYTTAEGSEASMQLSATECTVTVAIKPSE